MSTWLRLVRLVSVPRGRLALAVVLGALTTVAGAGLMASAGYLITRAAERPAILSLSLAIVAVRFFGLARPLARYAERLTSHDVALRVLPGVRARLLARLEPLAPARLDGYRQGDLLARMVADVDALQDVHLRALAPPLAALLASACTVGAATAVLPAAGAVLAAGLLAGGVLVPLLAARIDRRVRGQAAARGALTAELVEALGAAPELVAYGAAPAALDRIAAADAALVRIGRRDALAAGIADAAGLVVTGATVAGVLAVAIGSVDRVLVGLLGLLALAAFDAVQPLPEAARRLGATLAAGRRVLELADREPAVRDPAVPALMPEPPLALALEDVDARYAAGEQLALRGFALRLAPGSRTALVGPSGAGKTTVVNLLLRFLDPERGRVSLGGRDVRELSQEAARRAVAVAGQEAHVFATSIRDNVRLGRPGASDAEIRDVLARARLLAFVEGLPDGLDTPVGEHGLQLSGGQRQRLLLARALLLDAPVLVLDEPAAHLDGPTATALLADVFRAAGERTVLLITHRREGLDLVDDVVALEAR